MQKEPVWPAYTGDGLGNAGEWISWVQFYLSVSLSFLETGELPTVFSECLPVQSCSILCSDGSVWCSWNGRIPAASFQADFLLSLILPVSQYVYKSWLPLALASAITGIFIFSILFHKMSAASTGTEMYLRMAKHASSKYFKELFHYFKNVLKWLVGLLAVTPSSYLPKQHLKKSL